MKKQYYEYEYSDRISGTSTSLIRSHPLVTIPSGKLMTLVSLEGVSLVSPVSNEVIQKISHPTDYSKVTCAIFSETSHSLFLGFENGDVLAHDVLLNTSGRLFKFHSSGVKKLQILKRSSIELLVSLSQTHLAVSDPHTAEVINSVSLYGGGDNWSGPGVDQEGLELGRRVVDFEVLGGNVVVLTEGGVIRMLEGMKLGLLQVFGSGKGSLEFCKELNIGGRRGFSVWGADEEVLIFWQGEDGKLEESPTKFVRMSFFRAVQVEQLSSLLLVLNESRVLEAYKLSPGRSPAPLFKGRTTTVASRMICAPGATNGILYFTTGGNGVSVFGLETGAPSGASKTGARIGLPRSLAPKSAMSLGPMGVSIWSCLAPNDQSFMAGFSDSVWLWDALGQPRRNLSVRQTSSGAFLAAGRLAVLASLDGRALLFDVFTGTQLAVQRFSEDSRPLRGLAVISQSPPRLAVLVGDLQAIILSVEKKSDKFDFVKLRSVQLREKCLKLRNSPDEKGILALLADNSISLLHSDSLKEAVSFYGHSLAVTDAAISTDGYVLASVSEDKSLRIWDKDFGNCRRIINNTHPAGPTCLVLLKDTHYALTGGKEGLVKFWDLDTFDQLRSFDSRCDSVRCISVSSIGDFFYVAGTNRTVRKFIQTKDLFYAGENDQQLAEEQALKETLLDQKIADQATLNKKARQINTAEQLMETLDSIDGDTKETILEKESAYITKKIPVDRIFSEDILDRLDKIDRDELDSLIKFMHFSYLSKLLPHLLWAAENGRYIDLVLALIKLVYNHNRRALWQSPDEAMMMRMIVDRLTVFSQKKLDIVKFNKAALSCFIQDIKSNSE